MTSKPRVDMIIQYIIVLLTENKHVCYHMLSVHLELSYDVGLVLNALAMCQTKSAAKVDKVVKRFDFFQRRRVHLHQATDALIGCLPVISSRCMSTTTYIYIKPAADTDYNCTCASNAQAGKGKSESPV